MVKLFACSWSFVADWRAATALRFLSALFAQVLALESFEERCSTRRDVMASFAHVHLLLLLSTMDQTQSVHHMLLDEHSNTAFYHKADNLNPGKCGHSQITIRHWHGTCHKDIDIFVMSTNQTFSLLLVSYSREARGT
jgi:hypothetical protein